MRRHRLAQSPLDGTRSLRVLPPKSFGNSKSKAQQNLPMPRPVVEDFLRLDARSRKRLSRETVPCVQHKWTCGRYDRAGPFPQGQMEQ